MPRHFLSFLGFYLFHWLCVVPLWAQDTTLAPLATTAQPAINTLDSLRREYGQAKADTSRMQVLFQIGVYHTNQNLDSARWYANKALGLARKAKHRLGEYNSLDLLGYTFSERDIPKSMQLAFEKLHIAQELNNPSLIRSTYQHIGLLYLYLENYPQAIAYFKQVQTLALQGHDKYMATAASTELGGAYLALQKLDSARYYLTAAAKEDPIIQKSPFYLYYRARLEGTNQPGKAKAYFRQSIQTFKAQGNLRGLGFACRWYSEFLWKRHQPDSSILMAKKGLQAGQVLMSLRTIYYNSRQLTTYYQALGQLDSAYKYQSSMVAARDSLFSQQKINQFQNTLIDEQQRVQRLQAEKSRFESQVKIYGLLVILSGSLLITGLLYRTNREKQTTNSRLLTLNHEIEQQKQEIESQRDSLGNTLSKLQVTQNQLIQKEKLASLGELTAGIAHEIQNPLNFVNNFSDVSIELVDELKDEAQAGHTADVLAIANDLTQNLQKIHLHGSRASRIVKGMLDHSRPTSGEHQPTDLNSLAEEYLQLAYQGQRGKDKSFQCELVTHYDPALGKVNVAPGEIGRVLLNLYTNAFYAVEAKTKTASTAYEPQLVVHTQRQDNQVLIQVRDNGIGMAEAIKAKVFQPFFTTKPTGEGTGLGLSLSYDIIAKGHGGSLTVESQEGEGTEFVIQLPVLS